MILAGDVGGTQTRLALFEPHDGALCERRAQRYESRRYPGLAPVIAEFIGADARRVTAIGCGMAGPVVDGRCEATNLSWVVDVRDFAALLPGVPVVLVNDLVAAAAGVLSLGPEQRAELQAGTSRPRATRAVIAPGTGLGESVLLWEGDSYHPMPMESGHTDFAPRTDDELALLEHLRARLPRVTAEHVLAGPGFSRLHDFLRDTGRAEEPAWVTRELAAAEDRNAAITRLALERRAPICERALELWLSALGSEAGNLALRTVAAGGVYLAGGIAAAMVERLRGDEFLRAFRAKPPLERFLAEVRVQVVLDERTGLRGAARLAARATGIPLDA